MIKVRIERKPEFKIVGRKIWISGTDNEAFGLFWQKSHKDGLVELLHKIRGSKQNTIIDSGVFGVSCVEKDPSNRSFYFFIAAECDEYPKDVDLEKYFVPACEWAVFEKSVGSAIGAFDRNEELIGSVMTYWFSGTNGITEEIFVLPQWRRKGIAQYLVREALLYLKECGKLQAELEVRKSNESAMNLYYKMGYEIEKIEYSLGLYL